MGCFPTSRPHINPHLTQGQTQGPKSQISRCPREGEIYTSCSPAPAAHQEAGRKPGNERQEKGEGILGASARGCPPLSVTVPDHRFSHHPGLPFQLLHLLQKCFLAGVLGPVSQGRDKKDMTRELYTALKMSCSLRGPHLMPADPGPGLGTPRNIHCPRAWQGLHLRNLGSTPSPAEQTRAVRVRSCPP